MYNNEENWVWVPLQRKIPVPFQPWVANPVALCRSASSRTHRNPYSIYDNSAIQIILDHVQNITIKAISIQLCLKRVTLLIAEYKLCFILSFCFGANPEKKSKLECRRSSTLGTFHFFTVVQQSSHCTDSVPYKPYHQYRLQWTTQYINVVGTNWALSVLHCKYKLLVFSATCCTYNFEHTCRIRYMLIDFRKAKEKIKAPEHLLFP